MIKLSDNNKSMKNYPALQRVNEVMYFQGDSQEEVTVDLVSDSSSDEDELMQRVKGHKVLTTPAVRRIAKENKVCGQGLWVKICISLIFS